MRSTATLTVDVEMDAPPCLNTWRGVEEGLPLLLDVLSVIGAKATFFTLGIVAVKYPRAVSRIVDEGHELGSHGWDHSRLDKLSPREAVENVKRSLRVLRDYGEVRSFRAPNFKLPHWLLGFLKEEGVEVDSSIARYKPPFPRGIAVEEGLVRVPASYPSSVFRLPFLILKPLLLSAGSPVVLDLHPWELAEVRCASRPDLTAGVGRELAVRVARSLAYLESTGYSLLSLGELVRAHLERAPALR